MVDYRVSDATDYTHDASLSRAVDVARQWADAYLADNGGEMDDDGTPYITATVGWIEPVEEPIADAEWARLRGHDCLVTDLRFNQIAAVLPATTMRAVLKHLRATGADEELIAEVAASLVGGA